MVLPQVVDNGIGKRAGLVYFLLREGFLSHAGGKPSDLDVKF